jgi:AAA15 family ATPase/GTPase/5S rRNA maturation endonuclease (ribonuclease M5)
MAIRIEKIEIENFRSFKERKYSRDFDDFSSINIITGINNSGKTNILRAIYLFFNPDTYNPELDMNYIKQITGGGSMHPKITIRFLDKDISDEPIKYEIICDLNQKNKNKNYYSIKFTKIIEPKIRAKFLNSAKIKSYLDSKFKCVYLSTTDEVIEEQAENALNDMIFQYYKKRNKDIKESIEKFEKAYNELISTFKDNIEELELGMGEAFSILKSDGFNISPKLELNETLDITDFLQENLMFKINDSYVQRINSKGAGIQRASIILMNLFLLNEIYTNKNKIILLDEPEAFLYPLLIKKIKEKIDTVVTRDTNSQVFLTTHSSIFLRDMNKENYRYFNIEQERKEKEYQRSKNQKDINKYSIIYKYDRSIKNKVLRNYGLLDTIEDYEDVIIVEGQTDKNYIEHILRNEKIIPQIRYPKEFTYDYLGKGANAILNILAYLNNIDNVERNVFVILDGDIAGQETHVKIKKMINNDQLKNLKIKCKMLPEGKVIEDAVYSSSELCKKLYTINECFKKVEKLDERISNYKDKKGNNVLKAIEAIIEMYNLEININEVKRRLSQELDGFVINDDWIIDEIRDYFNL